MTDVAVARNIIQQEEIDYRSGITEGTLTRISALNNFHAKRQYDTHGFFLNGPYEFASGQIGIDGLYVFQFDVEVVGVSVFNNIAGSSGTTTLDIHWLTTSGGNQGTIFGTKAIITSSAPNFAFGYRNLEDGSTLASTGVTVPTFVKTQFDQGDAVRIDCDTAMIGAENCGVTIHFRPR